MRFTYLVNDSLLSFITFSCGSSDYHSIVSSTQQKAIMPLWRRHNSMQHSRRRWRLTSFTSMNPAFNSPMFSPAKFRLSSNSDKKWASFPSLLFHVSNLKSACIANTITCNNLPGHSFESPHETRSHLTYMCRLFSCSRHSCRCKIRENVSLFQCGILFSSQLDIVRTQPPYWKHGSVRIKRRLRGKWDGGIRFALFS